MQSHQKPYGWGETRERGQHSGQIVPNNTIAIISVLIVVALVVLIGLSGIYNYFQSNNTRAAAGEATVILNPEQGEYFTVVSNSNGVGVRHFRQDSLMTTELLPFTTESDFNDAFQGIGLSIDFHEDGGNTLTHWGWNRNLTPTAVTPHDTLTLKNKESGEQITLRYFYATGILVNTTEVDIFDFNGRENYYGIVAKPMPDQPEAFLVVFNERWEIVPPEIVNE